MIIILGIWTVLNIIGSFLVYKKRINDNIKEKHDPSYLQERILRLRLDAEKEMLRIDKEVFMDMLKLKRERRK